MSSIIGPFWSKQAKLEGGLDPLGLDRASDRLTSELIPGVTVNVNMARYFSFFCWLFKTTKTEKEDALVDEIIRAEKVYALGAALAHNGDRCSNGIAGSELIGRQWDIKGQVNLNKIHWLTNNGVYLGLYKGPLFRLGLLQRGSDGKLGVTAIGEPLADAFATSVSFTQWARTGRGRSSVTRAEVEEFGRQACPCSLRQARSERAALGRLFFQTPSREGRMLSQSLGLILSLVDQCELFHFDRLEQSFRLAIYYRQIYNEKGHGVPFKVRSSLEDVLAGWRSFQAHDYFSFALESFFTAWLEAMLGQPGQRLTIEQFLNDIGSRGFFTTLNSHLGIRLSATSLQEVTLDRLLSALIRSGSSATLTAESSLAFDKTIRLEHRFSEEQLVDGIWDRFQAGGQLAERCAEALLLLLVLYARFYSEHVRAPQSPNWRRYEAAASQSKTDLGLPRIYWIFQQESLPRFSIYEFLTDLLSNLVVKQALDIRDERRRDLIWFSEAGLAGLSGLMPSIQLYQYHFPFESYRYYRNTSKLGNALALLQDIDYVTNKNGYWELTADGRNRLEREFES